MFLSSVLPFKLNEVESYYGLGWRIFKHKQHPNQELIFHSGYIAGAVSFIGYIPSEKIDIIILINQETSKAIKNGLNFWKEVIKF